MNNKITFAWFLVVLQMILIFYFSAQPAAQSKKLSSEVVEIVVETIKKVAPKVEAEKSVENIHFLIRKNAHFFVYLILGVLTLNATKNHGLSRGKTILIALGICITYAISDEIHQIYVPGRSGELRDVLIDSAGSLTGIIGYFAVTNRMRRANSCKKGVQ